MALTEEATRQDGVRAALRRDLPEEESVPLVTARPVRYDLLDPVGRALGVIALVVDEENREQWLLEMDSFGDRRVSVRFTHERDAHQLAEEFALANTTLKKVADKLQRNGFEYEVS